MKCSIIIATRNKAPSLSKVLHSIYTQKPPFEFEVIICDDGSDDGTADLCTKYPVSVIHREPHEWYGNPAYPRNLAMQVAAGEILINQSDEVVHQYGDTIQRLVEGTSLGTIVMATVFNGAEDPKGILSPDHAPVTAIKMLNPYVSPFYKRPLFFLGAVHRDDIFSVGCNDLDFIDAGYDDEWLGMCLLHGRKVIVDYRTDIIGIHLDHPRPENLPELYAKGRAKIAKKIQNAIDDPQKWKAAAGPWGTYPPERKLTQLVTDREREDQWLTGLNIIYGMAVGQRATKILQVGIAGGDALTALALSTHVTGGRVTALDEKEKSNLIPVDYGSWDFEKGTLRAFLQRNKQKFQLVLIETENPYDVTLDYLYSLRDHLEYPATVIINHTEMTQIEQAVEDFSTPELVKKHSIPYGTKIHEDAYFKKLSVLHLDKITEGGSIQVEGKSKKT